MTSREHTKYGYCPLSRRWVRRDGMRSINVVYYDDQNHEHKIRLRFARSHGDRLLKFLRRLAWDGKLQTQAELVAAGIWPDQRGYDLDVPSQEIAADREAQEDGNGSE